MFSYGICEVLGLFNCWITCAVTKKITEKTFFSWFGILTMKILALAICDTRQKTIQYLDISLLAADPLITVSLSLDGI